MAMNIADFFDQEAYTDITIKFSGRETKAHKIILCSNSEYFKRLCGPDSKFKEADEQSIELFDDNADALEAMLRYIYTFKIRGKGDWRFYLEVIAVANKYQLQRLRNKAFKKLKKRTSSTHDPEVLMEMVTVLPKYTEHCPAIADLTDDIIEQNIGALFRKSSLGGMVILTDEMQSHVLSRLDAQKQYLYTCRSCGRQDVVSNPEPTDLCPGPACFMSYDKSDIRACWLSDSSQ